MNANPRKTVRKQPRPDLHDCAKGRMHDLVAKRVVTTMPGGYIA
jgi:hypothetical protein